MNLRKGVFRIWLVFIPVFYFISFYLVSVGEIDIDIPFYTCDGYNEKNHICTLTLDNKVIRQFTSCYLIYDGPLLTHPFCHRFEDHFKNNTECNYFLKNAKRKETSYINKSKVDICENNKKADMKSFITSIIVIVLIPLTFYPIFLFTRRLILWIRDGFFG